MGSPELESTESAEMARSLREAVPDLEALLEQAFADTLLFESDIHGEGHWLAVARAGLELARRDPRVDPVVVFLFAVLHDTRRDNESYDVVHGPEAARLARALAAKEIQLSEQQQSLLEEALHCHTESRTDPDPTIGACFDSDRLDFWRFDTPPNPRLLSTPSARDPRLIEWARDLHEAESGWQELYDGFAELTLARVEIPAGAEIGYRGWRYHLDGAELVLTAASTIQGSWGEPGQPVVANCYLGRDHQAPHIDCQCGIHVALPGRSGYGMARYLNGQLDVTQNLVLGRVFAWGMVDEMRARFVYPESFMVLSGLDGDLPAEELAARLEQYWAVPVSVAPWAELIAELDAEVRFVPPTLSVLNEGLALPEQGDDLEPSHSIV